MVTLVAPLASFGLGGFWLNIFGQEGWQAVRWLRASFLFAGLSTALVLTALFAWAMLGPHDITTRGLLIVLSLHLLGQVIVELISSKLQLEERYAGLAVWQFLPHLLRLLLAAMLAFVLLSQFTLYSVAYVYALISASVCIVGVVMLWRMYRGQLALKGHGDAGLVGQQPMSMPIGQVVARTWPFGLAGIFYLIYFQSDIILLKYMVGNEAAGVYNVAFVIIAAVYILPNVIYQKFLLPKIHRWANHDRELFYRVYRKGNWLMLALGSLAMLGIWLLAPWGIPILFGDNYTGAVLPLTVLALAVPARFLSSSAGAALSTQGHMIRKIYIMSIAALINVILNILTIPLIGVLGAAASTVITEIILVVMLQVYAVRKVFLEFKILS